MGGWFTADRSDGTVYAAAGGMGISRDSFARALVEHLRTMPDDEATPQQVTLYEWNDATDAGIELTGKLTSTVAVVIGAETWTVRAARGRYGEISYEYVGNGDGDWLYLPDSHPEPDGQRADGTPTSR